MSRLPTHRLKVFDKTSENRGELGAGWENDDGSISSVVNPGCSLVYNPDFVYTLFLIDRKRKEIE